MTGDLTRVTQVDEKQLVFPGDLISLPFLEVFLMINRPVSV